MLAFESECLPLDSSFRCKFPFDWTYLDFVQDQISKNGVFDDLFLQEKEAVTVLLNAVQAQEEFWQENSRLNWHLNGDRNIAFFFFSQSVQDHAFFQSNLFVENMRLDFRQNKWYTTCSPILHWSLCSI